MSQTPVLLTPPPAETQQELNPALIESSSRHFMVLRTDREGNTQHLLAAIDIGGAPKISSFYIYLLSTRSEARQMVRRVSDFTSHNLKRDTAKREEGQRVGVNGMPPFSFTFFWLLTTQL
jgi:hypothetical protein